MHPTYFFGEPETRVFNFSFFVPFSFGPERQHLGTNQRGHVSGRIEPYGAGRGEYTRVFEVRLYKTQNERESIDSDQSTRKYFFYSFVPFC